MGWLVDRLVHLLGQTEAQSFFNRLCITKSFQVSYILVTCSINILF